MSKKKHLKWGLHIASAIVMAVGGVVLAYLFLEYFA